ncbi:flagellar biosynthesis protein FlhB [Porticoccus sp. W117]|uniref:flagellar biosynthesis protein FlhB n=1 Tax=Porticoccus sp. W117 TaxID=3054777 RepID=UPI0025945BA4|nr:flagellar biosynthesis protein FlhB [Porticoccus sp. W117]MDM3870978.1 flagellar biosynthesis protein FlhB [Porticoccus sp. W117]
MSEHESGQEKTEQPTPKRLREARKKGQVARSRELNTMLSLLAGAVGLLFLGDTMFTKLSLLVSDSLTLEPKQIREPAMMAATFADSFMTALWLMTPLFVLLIAAAFAGPLFVGGFAFSMKAVAFKLEKINPLKGLKRMFSMKSLVELLKAVAKFLVVAGVAAALLWSMLDSLLALGVEELSASLAHAAQLCGWAFVAISAALILIAAIDVPFQLFQHNKQLKMTKQEVKDELKESEGRPEVKGRVRQLQREMSQRRMMEEVPKADVVITNPTHFAVALKYDDTGNGAPIVVAKGCDHLAARIRQVAESNHITLFSAPPLARALYATTELNQEIPADLYLAVAQVLAYVYQLNNMVDGQAPEMPTDLPVPEGEWSKPVE